MVGCQSLVKRDLTMYLLITETIVRGIDIVSKDLIKRLESKGESAEINVYFTGT